MIVNLNLQDKTIIVIGGGNEAQKRINYLLKQDCEITVISDSINSQINKWVKAKKIKFKKQKIQDTKFISKFKPHMIITTTNNKAINQKIINSAKRNKIIAYSSDNPDESDFSNPAIIDFENMIQIAIFTGGQSPAMSKKIKTKSEKILKKIITKEDIAQIKIQKIARKLAKETIPTQTQRRECLHSIMIDNEIDQLIKDGKLEMNQNIINARVTFRNAPIHILEKFTIRNVENAYEQFKKHSGLDECVIIQTCNRIELFGKSKTYDQEKIKKTWASLTGLEEEICNDNLEFVENHEALHHLLKLTSGLDSMVIGEEQILGQIKNSITSARQVKASGQHLNTLFDKAIRIGTRIRNSSGIGRGGISVGSMAVKLVEENIDELKTKKILLIGTGEVSTLVAKSLQRRGYSFDVTSRTIGRSHTFCETMGGEPVKFEKVFSGFDNYDVLFVATTAPYFLVTYERIMDAMKGKKNGMMVLDLSNPRTVDEKVATIGGVKLMNLDQIAEMVEKNMNARLNKVKSIENIINEEVSVLEASMKRLDAEPLVKDVFKSIECLREKELRKALQMLDEKDEKKIRIIEELTKAVVESIVSTPMNNIRKASEQGKPDILELASKLFDYKKQNQVD